MRVILKIHVLLSFLIFSSLCWYGFSGVVNVALALDIDKDAVLWNHLSYRAKSIFGKVKTDVHLTAVPIEAVADVLINHPAVESLRPSGDAIYSLTVDSNIDPLFGAEEILNTQSVFDPDDICAFQRVRLRQGKDKWQKSYLFTKTGVFRLRRKPKNASEENLPLDRWTKIRNHFYSYGDKARSCSRILEPASLLYVVSAINLASAPDHLTLCVFNKKQLHMVKVMVHGAQSMKVDYLKTEGKNQIRVDQKIDTVKISFQPRNLAPEDKEPEAFSFLGLKGDFDIFVDKDTQLPVQISGKISTYGKIDIKLAEVSYSGTNGNQN
jgi:hypothetical protein